MKRLRRLLVLVALWGLGVYSGVNGSSRLFFSNRTASINLQDGSNFIVGSAISDISGSIIKNSGATISGSSLSFVSGSYEEDGNNVILTGSVNPTTNIVTLDGSKRLRADPGRVFSGLSISGSANRIEGQPVFTKPIIFDAAATATIAMQGPLTQNIQFDAGGSNTLRLESDLNLADDVTIVNDGTIDVNGCTFAFGGRELTIANDIYWLNAGDVSLNARWNLTGTFRVNSETTINGNGNVIDVSGGGVFDIKASTTIYITDAVLVGLKNTTFVFGDNGSTVRFCNVDVNLGEDVSFTQGLFYIDGPATAILHNHTWAFSTDSKLTVSTVTVWKDQAGASALGDIIFQSASANYSSINSGTIKEIGAGGGSYTLPVWVEATSNAIDYWSDYVVDNSNAIVVHESRLDGHDTNIVNNATDIANNSGAIIVHESRLDTVESDIINNSGAIVLHESRLDTAESSISTNATNITNNSNAIDYWSDYIIENSVAVNELDGRVTTNALNLTSTYNYFDNLITNTMNDVHSRIDGVINDVATNAADISTNAGNISTNAADIAVLETTSVYLENRIDANSNAIVGHESRLDGHDTSIANNATDIANNSGAIVVHESRLDTVESDIINNSGAIVEHETRLDTAESSISTNATNITNNSNAIVEHESRLDSHDTSIANNVTDIANNSGAIVVHESRLDTVESDIINNSGAIVEHENRLDTAESSISTNATNITNNSNAIDYWSDYIIENSVAVNELDGRVTTNALNLTNTYNYLNSRIDTNSTNITSTYNYFDALITATMDEVWQSIGDLDVTALETRVDTLETTSVYLENRIDANSNAIVEHESRLDSHDTSIANNATDIANNSGAIVVYESRLDTAESDITNNSNAIVGHESRLDGHDTSIANNVTDIANNSGAIVVHESRLDTAESDIINNSGAIVEHENRLDTAESSISTNVTNITNNSNAIDYWSDYIIENSVAVNELDGRVTTNALNLTNTYNCLNSRIDANSTNLTSTYNYFDALITTTMDEVWQSIGDLDVTALETRVDTLETTSVYLENRITNTMNNVWSEIESLQDQIDYIDVNSGDIIVDNNSNVMVYDIFVSPAHKITFTSDVFFSGSTHFIHFSQAQEPLLVLDPGITVTLQDVLMSGFSESKISFGAGSSLIFGDNSRVELFGNESLGQTWTFSGSVTIDGAGKKINLVDTGTLYVLSGGELRIQDARIIGLESNKIICEDNTASVIFDNCELFLTDTFNFGTGSILFERDVSIGGTHQFNYNTSMASTIAAHASLCLEKGLTFSYDSASTSSLLLVFEDSTSKLVLNGATLHTTATGLSLRKGTIEIKQKSYFSADDVAITFGNNIVSDDFSCVICSGASLVIERGSLRYCNVGASGISAANNTSSINVLSGASLKLYKSINLGDGIINLYGSSTLARISEAIIISSVVVHGAITYSVLYD